MLRRICHLSGLFALSIFFAINCSSNKNSAPAQSEAAMIYVDSVNLDQTVSPNEQVQVTVKGNLPSPAYMIERFEVDVNDKVVKITPVVQHDANKMAAQVLVPFERTCNVGKLTPGTYEVQVLCKGESIRRNFEVK